MLDLRAGDRSSARRSPCTGRCSSRSAARRAPTIAGPRTVVRSRRAPGSITTRPSTCESISSPSMRSRRLSRIRRLASSMSSRRPVSFHQPRTMCGSTRMPASTRCWIASVISSSPRAEGSIARAASWIGGGEHVHAHQRQVGRRLGPASRRAARRARPRPARRRRELGDAVVLGVGHGRQQDQRVGLVLAEGRRPDRRSRPAAGCRRGTSRTGSSPRKGSAVSTAWASPSGSSCTM